MLLLSGYSALFATNVRSTLIQRCSLRSVCYFHCYYSKYAILSRELQKNSVVTRVLSLPNFEFWPLLIGILSTMQLQEGHLIVESSLLIEEAHQKHESHIKKCNSRLSDVSLPLK